MTCEKLTPKKIVIRSVNWIGDAVMSMPAVHQLRKTFPGAKINLLVKENIADLWKNNTNLDGLITFSKSESLCAIKKKIKEYNFDLAVVFPNSFRSAFEMWLARIPNRVGFGYGLRSLLLTIPVRPPHKFVKIKKVSKQKIIRLINDGKSEPVIRFSPEHHHIYNYLRIVGAIGASQEPIEPQIIVPQIDIDLLTQKFGLNKLSGRKILGINPGAEYGVAKRWFPERFVDAAIQIYNKTKCGILIFGGQKDESYCEQIYTQIKSRVDNPDCVINLTGKTSLTQLCAALKLCNAVISNDTGPAHIAAAVGTRIVTIFASTSPELTSPGLPHSDKHVIIRSTAPCSPCFRRECPIDFRCMKEITVEKIVVATLSILSTNH
ncbi:MAG: lipopolysaccharide heptosyltransferase II [Verrucomicrobiae bacterium]|nr:lipopolysaccharide heptosyltransferase II [Verrucomicrobiae bacterium]